MDERGFLRLRRLFDAPPSAWTGDHLHAAVTRGESEDFDLDFKKALYDKDDKGKFELAKDVAAMANHLGGVIALGIAEVDARASAALLVDLEDGERRRMHDLIIRRVLPTPIFDLRPVEDPAAAGRGFYVLTVPQSPLRPHAVRGQDDALYYPRRNGTGTRYLAETEVADAYRERFGRGRNTLRRVRQVQGEGLQHFPRVQPAITMTLSLAPEAPGERSMTRQDVERLQNLALLRTNDSWRFHLWGPRLFVEVDVKRLALRDEHARRHFELHTDGAGFAASRERSFQEGQQPRVFATELVLFTTLLLETLVENAVEAGASGNAVALLRLDAEPVVEAQPLRLLRRDNEDSWPPHSVRTWPPARRDIQSEHSIDLEAVATDRREHLIAVRLLLTEVFQSFHAEDGVAQISESGALVPSRWSPQALQVWPVDYERE